MYDSKQFEKWVDLLPLVRRILMTHPHSSIGAAPATLLYGSVVQLERGIFPEASLPATETSRYPRTLLDITWIEESRKQQETLLQMMQKHQQELDQRNVAIRTSLQAEEVTTCEVGYVHMYWQLIPIYMDLENPNHRINS